MTVDKVIELGEKASVTTDYDWLSAPWWVWLLIIISFLITVAAIHGIVSCGDAEGFGGLLIYIVIVTIVYMVTIDKETHDGVAAWKKDVACLLYTSPSPRD